MVNNYYQKHKGRLQKEASERKKRKKILILTGAFKKSYLTIGEIII